MADDKFIMGLSAVASILGLVLSVLILFVTFQVNRKITKKLRKYSDVENYNKERIEIKDKLTACQLLIQRDGILKHKIVTDILNQIGNLENYTSIISLTDRFKIWRIKKELNKELEQLNKYKVGKQLSYFIVRCNKKEEFFL